jgi:hypothetical protein
MAAIGINREEGRVLGKHLVAEALQFQFADDSLLQQADQVSAGRYAIAGPEFFGDRAPAEHLAPLQNQHFLAGAREVSRGDEAVVAAADNDSYVVLRGHWKATTASGGSVIEMWHGRPWFFTFHRRHHAAPVAHVAAAEHGRIRIQNLAIVARLRHADRVILSRNRREVAGEHDAVRPDLRAPQE